MCDEFCGEEFYSFKTYVVIVKRKLTGLPLEDFACCSLFLERNPHDKRETTVFPKKLQDFWDS